MGAEERDDVYGCEIEAVLAVVGGKWKLFILWTLRDGVLRYAELRRKIHGVSERVLIEQLRELEADGMVRREQYPQIPPKVEYSLTAKGRSLAPALDALAAWGRDHALRTRSAVAAGIHGAGG
jgi:DNA-binding HxlR family transcriptional regulator